MACHCSITSAGSSLTAEKIDSHTPPMNLSRLEGCRFGLSGSLFLRCGNTRTLSLSSLLGTALLGSGVEPGRPIRSPPVARRFAGLSLSSSAERQGPGWLIRHRLAGDVGTLGLACATSPPGLVDSRALASCWRRRGWTAAEGEGVGVGVGVGAGVGVATSEMSRQAIFTALCAGPG